MTEAYLYEKLVNRKNRYRKKSLLTEALQNYRAIAEVNGCFVSQTSSYVDIALSESSTPQFLFGLSAVKFTNSDYCDYIAFIDRIEPNNFNVNQNEAEYQYYRLYITIDWWSTIMYNWAPAKFEEICNSIEGNVERAHLDDIEKIPQELGGGFRYSLDNTVLEAEEFTSKYINQSHPLNKFNEYSDGGTYNDNMQFLYVFINPTGSTFEEQIEDSGFTLFDFHGRLYTAPLVVGVLPFINGHMPRSIWHNSDRELVIDDKQLLTKFTSDDIVYMYLSNVAPCKYARGVDTDGKDFVDFYGNLTESEVPIRAGIVGVGRVSDGNYCAMWCVNYIKANPINLKDIIDKFNRDNYLHLWLSKDTPQIPQTYGEYLLHNPKFNSSIYNTIYIHNNGENMIVDYNHYNMVGDSYIIYEQSNAGSGGCIYRMSNGLYSGESINTIMVGNDGIFKSVKTVDDLEINRAYNSMINNLVKGSSRGAKISVMPLSLTSSFLGAMNAVGVINQFSEDLTGLRDVLEGHIGGVIAGVNNMIMKDTANVVLKTPYNATTILKHLALYGYNTYLHPHEVLKGHERKYFNYIKTNNANVNIPYCSTDIKLALEEMFNNGVWLWNNVEEFMNYEVPNYPIIMEE